MKNMMSIVLFILATLPPVAAQTSSKQLHTNFLRPGLSLETAVSGQIGTPGEPFNLLRLKGYEVSKPIHDLGELKGGVRINSPQKALDYVRLTTTYPTWFLGLWRGQIYVEITDRNHAKMITTYGLPTNSPWKEKSGWMGILSLIAAKHSGLFMARVKPIQGGYLITRWLLNANIASYDPYKIMLVQEKVTQDGTYLRKILKQQSPPKLPDTVWAIPIGE